MTINPFRFRFSLRTLLLTVLLIASAGTLWHNRGPWYPAEFVDENGPLYDCKAGGQGRFLSYNIAPVPDGRIGFETVVHEFQNRDGAWKHREWLRESGVVPVGISPTGEYAFVDGDLYQTNQKKKLSIPERSKYLSFQFSNDDTWLECRIRNPPSDVRFVPRIKRLRMPDFVDGEEFFDPTYTSLIDPFIPNSNSPDGRFERYQCPGRECILDARTGRTLFDLSAQRWLKSPGDQIRIDFLAEPGAFVTWFIEPQAHRFIIWKLKRPLEWYGVFYLPEFWVAAALGLVLLWSLIADRRIGKSNLSLPRPISA